MNEIESALDVDARVAGEVRRLRYETLGHDASSRVVLEARLDPIVQSMFNRNGADAEAEMRGALNP